MVKGISLLIIGIGIIVGSIFLIIAELANPEIISDEYPEFLSNYNIFLAFLLFGVFLMFIGGPKFYNEQRKETETFVFKKVNLFWQVIGSLIPGFDLFVMYRIKKLRLGVMVFSIQYVIYVLTLTIIPIFYAERIDILTTLGYAIIVFMWSRQWNKQLLKEI